MARQVVFLGSTQEDLQEWPDEARREAGHQLWRVQNDRDPTDWKPMPIVGPGAREIRIQENNGQWRVLYVAKIKGLFMSCMSSRRKRDRRRSVTSI